jgi:hypothetical protein
MEWTKILAEQLARRARVAGVPVHFTTTADHELLAWFRPSWSESPLGYRLRGGDPVPEYLALQDRGVLEDSDLDAFALMFLELAVLEPDAEILKIPIDSHGVRWVPLGFRDR